MITIAYVSVPKDLTVVKSKIAFNLTKRQLICFSLGAAAAVPTYLLAKAHIGSDVAIFIMIAVAMPFFFLALYEKNGLTAEKIAVNIIRVKFLLPHARPYQTENFYRKLQEEVRRRGTTTRTTQLRLGENEVEQGANKIVETTKDRAQKKQKQTHDN